MLSAWPIWAIPKRLYLALFAGLPGRCPTDGGGNLIALAGRDGEF
jgi:hypothetical protein